jgi:hypothetical protein
VFVQGFQKPAQKIWRQVGQIAGHQQAHLPGARFQACQNSRKRAFALQADRVRHGPNTRRHFKPALARGNDNLAGQWRDEVDGMLQKCLPAQLAQGFFAAHAQGLAAR